MLPTLPAMDPLLTFKSTNTIFKRCHTGGATCPPYMGLPSSWWQPEDQMQDRTIWSLFLGDTENLQIEGTLCFAEKAAYLSTLSFQG